MADDGDAELPAREDFFLRAIDIVYEIEDKLALLADTLGPTTRTTDEVEELSEYAERVRNYLPYVLFSMLRQFNRVKDRLRDAHDSLSEDPLPDA